MFRKAISMLVAVASLAILAAPTLAAEVYRLRATATGLSASFTNLPEGDWDVLPPGDYFYTDVFAATQLAVGSEPYEENYACVYSQRFSIDEAGEWIDGDGVFTCGLVDSLTVDRRLTTGHLVASLQVEDCAAWDEETHECLEPVVLGSVDIDLTLTGIGRVQRSRGTSTGGTTGSSSYVYHSVSATRAAAPSGSIEFEGESLIVGATSTAGSLIDASGGWVEVAIGG